MQIFDLRQWDAFHSSGGDISFPALIDQVIIDSRRIASPNALFVALPGRYLDGHDFIPDAAKRGACFALVNQDYKPPHDIGDLMLLKVPNTLQAMQKIAALYRKKMAITSIAITGSLGKTLVKDLLYAMLSQEKIIFASPESFNSQIGVAMSLFSIESSHQFAIIEAGISQEGDMRSLINMIHPDHAILTNLCPSHLGTMQDWDTLVEEKLSLLHAVPHSHWVLLPNQFKSHIPLENTYSWDQSHPSLPHVVPLGPLTTTQQVPYKITFPDKTQFIGNMPGGHAYLLDHMNIASKAAWLLGISAESISSTLRHYTFQPMRVERWKTAKGGTVVNERYSSDISSVDAALRALRRETKYARKLFLFGGIRNLHTFNDAEQKQLIQAIQYAGVDHLLLADEQTAAILKPYFEQLSAEIQCFATQQAALRYLTENLAHDDLLLIKGANKLAIEHLEQQFDGLVCDNKLVINLAAIEENIRIIRQRLPSGTRIMAMIKALGYGTDSISLGHFLESCNIDIVGVAHVDEAITLRRAGLTQAIFAIHATTDEAEQIVHFDIEVAVSDLAQIANLVEIAQQHNKIIKVHLHVDTGMGRFGCRVNDALTLATVISASPALSLEGLMTHLASADLATDDDFTRAQLDKLAQVHEQLKQKQIHPRWIHAANSSGALRFPLAMCNMVRLGLGMFGLANGAPLCPALSLTSRLVGINTMKRDESVGYGHTYTVARDEQRIGILPIGYFDGLHTQYSGKGYVLVRGQPAPLIGRICMDFTMVDLTDIPDAAVSDPVLIFGKDESGHFIDPNTLASQGGTHVYQLISCLGPRIRRLFIYDEGL